MARDRRSLAGCRLAKQSRPLPASGDPQANYAAANLSLDAAAYYWQQCGDRAFSVQWGPWREAAQRIGERRAGGWVRRPGTMCVCVCVCCSFASVAVRQQTISVDSHALMV